MGGLSPEARDFEVPLFDIYSLSMKENFKKGIRTESHQYWPNAAAMTRHKKCHRKRMGIEKVLERVNELNIAHYCCLKFG